MLCCGRVGLKGDGGFVCSGCSFLVFYSNSFKRRVYRR